MEEISKFYTKTKIRMGKESDLDTVLEYARNDVNIAKSVLATPKYLNDLTPGQLSDLLMNHSTSFEVTEDFTEFKTWAKETVSSLLVQPDYIQVLSQIIIKLSNSHHPIAPDLVFELLSDNIIRSSLMAAATMELDILIKLLNNKYITALHKEECAFAIREYILREQQVTILENPAIDDEFIDLILSSELITFLQTRPQLAAELLLNPKISSDQMNAVIDEDGITFKSARNANIKTLIIALIENTRFLKSILSTRHELTAANHTELMKILFKYLFLDISEREYITEIDKDANEKIIIRDSYTVRLQHENRSRFIQQLLADSSLYLELMKNDVAFEQLLDYIKPIEFADLILSHHAELTTNQKYLECFQSLTTKIRQKYNIDPSIKTIAGILTATESTAAHYVAAHQFKANFTPAPDEMVIICSKYEDTSIIIDNENGKQHMLDLNTSLLNSFFMNYFYEQEDYIEVILANPKLANTLFTSNEIRKYMLNKFSSIILNPENLVKLLNLHNLRAGLSTAQLNTIMTELKAVNESDYSNLHAPMLIQQALKVQASDVVNPIALEYLCDHHSNLLLQQDNIHQIIDAAVSLAKTPRTDSLLIKLITALNSQNTHLEDICNSNNLAILEKIFASQRLCQYFSAETLVELAAQHVSEPGFNLFFHTILSRALEAKSISLESLCLSMNPAVSAQVLANKNSANPVLWDSISSRAKFILLFQDNSIVTSCLLDIRVAEFVFNEPDLFCQLEKHQVISLLLEFIQQGCSAQRLNQLLNLADTSLVEILVNDPEARSKFFLNQSNELISAFNLTSDDVTQIIETNNYSDVFIEGVEWCFNAIKKTDRANIATEQLARFINNEISQEELIFSINNVLAIDLVELAIVHYATAKLIFDNLEVIPSTILSETKLLHIASHYSNAFKKAYNLEQDSLPSKQASYSLEDLSYCAEINGPVKDIEQFRYMTIEQQLAQLTILSHENNGFVCQNINHIRNLIGELVATHNEAAITFLFAHSAYINTAWRSIGDNQVLLSKQDRLQIAIQFGNDFIRKCLPGIIYPLGDDSSTAASIEGLEDNFLKLLEYTVRRNYSRSIINILLAYKDDPLFLQEFFELMQKIHRPINQLLLLSHRFRSNNTYNQNVIDILSSKNNQHILELLGPDLIPISLVHGLQVALDYWPVILEAAKNNPQTAQALLSEPQLREHFENKDELLEAKIAVLYALHDLPEHAALIDDLRGQMAEQIYKISTTDFPRLRSILINPSLNWIIPDELLSQLICNPDYNLLDSNDIAYAMAMHDNPEHAIAIIQQANLTKVQIASILHKHIQSVQYAIEEQVINLISSLKGDKSDAKLTIDVSSMTVQLLETAINDQSELFKLLNSDKLISKNLGVISLPLLAEDADAREILETSFLAKQLNSEMKSASRLREHEQEIQRLRDENASLLSRPVTVAATSADCGSIPSAPAAPPPPPPPMANLANHKPKKYYMSMGDIGTGIKGGMKNLKKAKKRRTSDKAAPAGGLSMQDIMSKANKGDRTVDFSHLERRTIVQTSEVQGQMWKNHLKKAKPKVAGTSKPECTTAAASLASKPKKKFTRAKIVAPKAKPTTIPGLF